MMADDFVRAARSNHQTMMGEYEQAKRHEERDITVLDMALSWIF